MDIIILIIVLIVLALALIVIEICTPMFGLLGLLALAALTWAVYLGFTLSPVLGIVMIVAMIVALPVFIVWAVKVLPSTGLGRRLALLRKPTGAGEGTPEAEGLSGLIGTETTAETVLRPSGTIRVDGRRIVAQAEGGFIERGAKVRVVRTAGSHVVVRKIEEQ